MSRRVPLVLSCAAALLTVWFAQPRLAPAVYDGVCVPPSYAYLQPPSADDAGNPSSASHMVAVSNGSVPGVDVFTNEVPAPQAELSLDSGSLTAPAAATEVTLTIAPMKPPSIAPAQGTLDGNVYAFAASANAPGPVKFNVNDPGTLSLRPTNVDRARVVERFDGTKWTPLQTQYGSSCGGAATATVTQFGTYALVLPPATAGSSTSGSSVPLGIIGVVALLIGLGIALVALLGSRRARR